ncbi:hypothetical protein Tco_1146853 [Tanacetum coccineum]
MSRLYYNWIMSEGLKSREKPSNHRKTCNFVGRVRGIKVFIGNFTYECDFIDLDDVSSVIDHYLGGMVLGKPFVKQSKLTYDKEEGTIMLEKNDERVTFKMPHKMKRFKDIEDLNTDNIPPFFVSSKGDEEKGEDYDVNRFPDGDGNGDGDEAEKRGWGCIWEAFGGKARDLGSIQEETVRRHNTWLISAWRRRQNLLQRRQKSPWGGFRVKYSLHANLLLDVSSCVETASEFAATPSEVKGENITTISDVVTITNLKNPLEDSAGLTASGFITTPSDLIFYI